MRVVQPAGPKDPLAIRTIVISGLPPTIDANSLWKKIRKYGGAEKVEWPAKVNEKEDSSTGESALLSVSNMEALHGLSL